MPNKYVKVKGLNKVLFKFKRKNRRLNTYIQSNIPRYMNDVASLAKMMAPRDSGSLESAIKMVDKKTLFTYRGEVFIDANRRYTGTIPKTNVVGDYAKRIHDTQTPVGPVGLGKISRQKQLANPQVTVGGDFMNRAFDQIAPNARKEMNLDLRRIAKR